MGSVDHKHEWKDLFKLWQHWNSTLNLLTYGISFYSQMWSGSFFLTLLFGFIIYFVFIFIYDVFYYFLGISIINENETLRLGYNMSIMICDGGSATGSGLDYGFNLYDGNYEKDRDQAQKDKFDYAWDKLKLAPGMTLIDFGCGCGDWLDYVKSRGVEAVGINITEGQVEVCKRRGLDVIWTDWKNIASNKKLQARLYGFADCVTMWDTIEHYVPMKFRNNVEKQNEIYEFLFDTVKSCFKEGIVGRAWTSCLHIRSEKNVSFAQKFNNFILDKFHSGYYPEFESRKLSA